MTKRKAETLIEVITAMGIFGVIMAGVSDLIAGQTKNIADIIDKDNIMCEAQRLQYLNPSETFFTVTRGATTMSFDVTGN